ncbi:trithorax group protein osa [Drosophila novamexicana]|uniref:trithorax group protein osa n=1 Tax=Drosophila novamexicana TaxID=47314 RepID=UPI0011E5CE78|nr:trithorax group protein osa [Drosophila novamexicana]
MLLRIILMTTLCFCFAKAVLSGKELKRREVGFDNYGPPPRQAPQYGPKQNHLRLPEYGVPQQIPFREYGPPALKYDSPKLPFLGGVSGPSSTNGLYEQIKNHFGIPKPFYGPPHIHHNPALEYGLPPPAHYSPPAQPQSQYGPPSLAVSQYAPPSPKKQHHLAPQYRPPSQIPQFSTPPASPRPLPYSTQLYKPFHQPATSYGPPASGPLNLPSKSVYETPPNYGPPPLPVNLPAHQSASFNRVPENFDLQRLPSGPGGIPFKQAQIQIDTSGHTHSVTGSLAPFHTACDGWKPISAPIGTFIEENHIDTLGGYSHVGQSQSTGNVGGATDDHIVDGLSDEQLVAVALQDETINGKTEASSNGLLNIIHSEALQNSEGSIDDSYSKPPTDSFAPGTMHDYKYHTSGSTLGVNLPLAQGPAPHISALTSSYGQSQTHSQLHSNVNIQYSSQFGNPQHGVGSPKSPVFFRPPVPAGLIESIGATVQHLDQFGEKPPQQTPTYIPPAANEIALSGLSSSSQAINRAPLKQQPPPQIIVQQQLPQPQYGPAFAHQKLAHLQEYGSPVLLKVPQSNYMHPPLAAQHYLSNQQAANIHRKNEHVKNSYSISTYTPPFVQSHALPLTQQVQQFNQQTVLSTGVGPQQHQQPQVALHNCGQGPNLVSSTGYQVHQQQQFSSVSAASPDAYNAIAQSVPVAEQHTQFLAGPADSYGPPPSGNEIDLDPSGYASQKSAVQALPDGTDPQQLPGLNGLNVISAKKSQSIQLGTSTVQPTQNFQVQFDSQLIKDNHVNDAALSEPNANHEEILSQGLLQSILTAIEQPQLSSPLPQNHRAQSRSDDQYQDDKKEYGEDEQHEKQQSNVSVEVRVSPGTNDKAMELQSKGMEVVPIFAADLDEETKH